MAPAVRTSDFGTAGPRPGSGRPQRAALVLLRLCLGAFIFFFGVERASWLLDATPLTNQLTAWMTGATPISRWYLERLMPGAPVFARIVPLGSVLAGLALMLGQWTRMAAAVALVMVLSLQLGAGAMFRYAYLMDASGLPLVGGLVALMVGGSGKEKGKRKRE
jgi:uncharacterized membrane protein YphA (DoxX/SURF4 family)